MAKRDTLRLSQHQFIETGRDFNGRYWIAYSSGASVFLREPKEVRHFLNLSKGTPMREALDSWLASLEDTDNIRTKKNAPVKDASAPLSPELLATGFGPECHQEGLDQSDPQFATRMIT